MWCRRLAGIFSFLKVETFLFGALPHLQTYTRKFCHLYNMSSSRLSLNHVSEIHQTPQLHVYIIPFWRLHGFLIKCMLSVFTSSLLSMDSLSLLQTVTHQHAFWGLRASNDEPTAFHVLFLLSVCVERIKNAWMFLIQIFFSCSTVQYPI